MGKPLMQAWQEIALQLDAELGKADPDGATLETLAGEADRIMGIMVCRNTEGGGLERAGRDADAVALYEANVADGFEGSYPYVRLIRLYLGRGLTDEARRVAHAYRAAGVSGDARAESLVTKALGQAASPAIGKRQP